MSGKWHRTFRPLQLVVNRAQLFHNEKWSRIPLLPFWRETNTPSRVEVPHPLAWCKHLLMYTKIITFLLPHRCSPQLCSNIGISSSHPFLACCTEVTGTFKGLGILRWRAIDQINGCCVLPRQEQHVWCVTSTFMWSSTVRSHGVRQMLIPISLVFIHNLRQDGIDCTMKSFNQPIR